MRRHSCRLLNSKLNLFLDSGMHSFFSSLFQLQINERFHYYSPKNYDCDRKTTDLNTEIKTEFGLVCVCLFFVFYFVFSLFNLFTWIWTQVKIKQKYKRILWWHGTRECGLLFWSRIYRILMQKSFWAAKFLLPTCISIRPKSKFQWTMLKRINNIYL